MTPDEERQRIGKIIEERMGEMGITVPMLAEKSGVDATTIRAVLRGLRSPRVATRAKIAAVLGWQVGDVARIAVNGHLSLRAIPTRDLLHELCRRADRWDDRWDAGR